MAHRLINFVLAILMLIPAGICTCDGGVVSCLDHPVHNLTDFDAGQAREPFEATTGTDRDTTSHRCPPPCPHQPSCGVLAPEFLADASASDISTSLPVIHYAVVVEWPTPQPSRFDRRTAFTPLPASPIYLAHCVLLI